MRNKLERYISLGSQLKHTPRLTAPQILEQSRRAREMAEAQIASLEAQGFVQGFHDEMILATDEAHPFDAQKLKNAMTMRPDWSDAALAALVADVRKHESKCTSDFVTMDFPAMTDCAIMDEVNHAVNPLFAASFRPVAYPAPAVRQAVDVETVKAGDKVFMTGDPTPRTVLHIHVSKLFVSFTVVSHDDAMPHLIHRHRGALINKEVK